MAATLPAHPVTSQEATEHHFEKGVELFRVEQYATAMKEFERALSSASTMEVTLVEDIEYHIAVCEAELQTDGAEAVLEEFLEKYPGSLYSGKARLALANTYLTNKDYTRAKAQYDLIDASAMSPAAQRELYFNKGYAAFSEGDYREAESYFNRVEGDRMYGPSATYYKAYINYVEGNYSEARSGFLSLSNNRDYAPVLPFYMLHLDFRERDYRRVVDNGGEVLQKADATRRGEVLRIMAESYYQLGDYDNAISYLDAYVSEGNALNREEMYMYGYSSYVTGDFGKANEYLGKVAVGNDALAQNASFHIGSASLRTGNKLQAQQAFSLAMKSDEDKEIKQEAMFNFAKLQYELGNGMFNEIISTLNAYLEEFPDSPNADEARGYLMAAYLNSNNYKDAYDAIVQIKNPNNQEKGALQRIAYFRGLEYFNDGDYDNAMAMFNVANANRYMPRYTALTKFWSAETYYRQGQFTRAIPLYQDYIVLSPKAEHENIMSNYNLGYCYFNTKNTRESLVWFNKFIAAYPANDGMKADAYNRIGDINFLNRGYQGAIDNYDKAINIGTNEKYYAQYQKAISLGLTSGAATKISALQAIISDGRGDYVDNAMYELGNTYTKQDRFDDAIKTLTEFTGKYPDSPYYPHALLDLALASHNLGKNAEAMAYYKRVVDEYPGSSYSKDALLGVRNIYVENNDLDGYFIYANEHNLETNLTLVERDSMTYHAAEMIYIRGDHARAKPLFDKYLQDYPKGNYRTNATYNAADCAMLMGDTDAALAGYEAVAAMATNPFTVNSLLNAGAINYQKENYGKAAGYYHRLAELATNRVTVADGLSGYLRSTTHLNDPDKSIEAADYVLAAKVTSPELADEAKFALGKAYYDKGQKSDALKPLGDVAENPKTRNGAESLYFVAEILYGQGKTAEAEAAVFKFSEKGTSHQYWLGKAFILLGDIYVGKGDDFQAKATYQSIADGYAEQNDGIVEEAKEKLNKLNEKSDEN